MLATRQSTLALTALVALVASWAFTATLVKADDYLPLSNDRYNAKPTSYRKRIALTTPEEWLNEFTFDTQQNAYHGYVNFVDQQEARSLGMIGTGANGKGFRWGFDIGHGHAKRSSDNDNVLDRRAYKRNSLRFKSRNWYKDGLYVFTINKVPVGCSVWASIFTQSPDTNSKYRSEVDIFEFANGYNRPNAIVVHTQGVCDRPKSEIHSLVEGDSLMSTCTVRLGESGRRGCGIYLDHSGSPDATSVPKNMNNQPTIIAVERSQAAINAWFWTKAEAPTSLQQVTAQHSINTASFGKAKLSLPPFRACSASKDLDSEHVIVMMLDQCAGLPEFYWNKDGCGKKTGQSCPAYHNSPAATHELLSNGGGYFDFENFVFFAPEGQQGGPQQQQSTSTTTSTTASTDNGGGKSGLDGVENQHSFAASGIKNVNHGHGHTQQKADVKQFKAAVPKNVHHQHQQHHHTSHRPAGHFHWHHRPHARHHDIADDDVNVEERAGKFGKFAGSGDDFDVNGRTMFDHIFPHDF